MTEFKKIFLDTSPIIYMLDKNVVESLKEKTQRIFLSINEQEIEPNFVISTITCEEYLVIPYRTNNQSAVESLWHFISDSHITIYEVNMDIAVKAAQIRADYKYFKAMDALQLATACVNGCDLFLTNDSQLTQFTEIKCATIADWQFD
ncbi:MAG: PIN domain-containing protein [Selenomonadaceae bacterium]|nr:PIN domain-containing protein [Selenomonadaceae bacterium]MBR1859536.1 PIN domain-containing protein [Selenomonadaceae bacterium]